MAERSGGVKAMTDEQLERSIELIQEMIAKREAEANAKVIEAEVVRACRRPEPAAPRSPRPKVSLSKSP